MKQFTFSFLFLFLFLIANNSFAQSAATTEEPEIQLTDEQYNELYNAYVDSIEQTLTWMTGEAEIKNGLAKIIIPDGFRLLTGEEGSMVLTDIWGNPPNQDGSAKSLGLLFPEGTGLGLEDSYAINITYSEDGYIDDSDAKDMDYDELLETIQDGAAESNIARAEAGYETIDVVGWAASPFYDSENKKLHWAQEIKFGEDPLNTLNYNIRVLGRKGYLNLNAISDITVLSKVKNDIDKVLTSVNFTEGNRYADFDSSIDKVAAVGIGGLIAGKVLAKGGFFVMLAKFWKVIALGAVAFFASIKKFFTGGRKEEEEIVQDNTDQA